MGQSFCKAPWPYLLRGFKRAFLFDSIIPLLGIHSEEKIRDEPIYKEVYHYIINNNEKLGKAQMSDSRST